MTDRTVRVRLLAITGQFSTAMAAAGRDVSVVQRKIADGDQSLKRNQQQISRGMLLVGGAAVAAAGLAVTAFARFDKSMSNVKAVSGATADEMDDLRAAAIDAGKATVFSASESADAEAELAKAGVSTADILGGALTGALNLASAGNIDLANAATIAAQAMNIFKLRGADVSHIADVLAAGANKSAADVGQLGDALRQGGLLAAQTGLKLEDTVGVLSAFADNALIGSDAGTSLKTMLQRLVPQSAEAKAAMEKIGFSAYDAQGNFVGLENVAARLQRGLGGLTEEQRNSTLATIFGSDAVRAANVLYEEGAAGVADYTAAVDDNGAAARNAATQLDNLAGDVEQFKGSVETALIQSGSSANGVLRGLTQSATGLVNAYADAPPAIQATATAVTGVGGAAVFTLGAIGTLAPKLREGRAALQSFGTAGAFADRNLGRLGKTAGVVTAVLAVVFALDKLEGKIREMSGEGAPEVDRLTDSLVKMAKTGVIAGEAARISGDGLGDLGYQLKILSDGGAIGGIRAVDTGLRTLTFGLADNYSEFNKAQEVFSGYDQALAGLVQSGNSDVAAQIFNTMSLQVLAAGGSVDDLKGRLPGYVDALAGADTQQSLTADSAGEFGGAIEDSIPPVDEATQAVDDYVTSLDDLAGRLFGVEEAQDALTGKYAGLIKQVKEAKKKGDEQATSLKGNSEAALANREALRGIVDETANVVAKMVEHGASVDKVNGFIAKQRDRLKETETELGLSRGAAKRYDDAIRHIPDNIPVRASTTQIDHAIARVKELRRQAGIPISVTVGVLNRQSHVPTDGARAAGGPVRAFGLYEVGEHGRELFQPTVSGQIIPADKTDLILSAARSGSSMSSASPLPPSSGTTATNTGGPFMGDLIVYSTDPRVGEDVVGALDSQMYRLGRG